MVETCIAVTYNARQILRELKLKMNANNMSEVIVNLSELYNSPKPEPLTKTINSATLKQCYVCGKNLPSDCVGRVVADNYICVDCDKKLDEMENKKQQEIKEENGVKF